MSKKATALLERMKRSKSGWKRVDLDTVYKGYGFKIEPRAKHDKVYHPDFPQLLTYLPRHRKLAIAYVEELILKIAQLEELLSREEGKND